MAALKTVIFAKVHIWAAMISQHRHKRSYWAKPLLVAGTGLLLQEVHSLLRCYLSCMLVRLAHDLYFVSRLASSNSVSFTVVDATPCGELSTFRLSGKSGSWCCARLSATSAMASFTHINKDQA